nr:hypothetical protein [Tanacetum cinerariifolium]
MTGNRTQLMNFVSKFLGTVRFGNDQIARIMGYDLEVAFQKNTCFIHDLEGVDLISGSRDTNLYKISLDDMLKSSLICLLSKASKTKSWLWHRRLSHLNFACALGKSKKSSHQPKAEDTNQEKLYILHMDLCGPVRVASINEKSSGLGLHVMTPVTPSTGLVSNPGSQQPFQEAAAPRAKVLANSLVSISIIRDAPSTSIPSSQAQEHSPIISQGFEESPKTPTFYDDPLNEYLQESPSQGSSSNMIQIHTSFEHLGRWTKDHPIANVMGDPSRFVSTRKQLETNAMWCYFDAFLSLIELKNFNQAITKPSWINAMQEKIHEFKRLEVWELVPCPDNVFLMLCV